MTILAAAGTIDLSVGRRGGENGRRSYSRREIMVNSGESIGGEK